MPIPNRYYESVRGWSPARAGRTSPTRTASTRSPTRSGRSTGTAASPPAPATRSTRPAPTRSEYWNRTAFVAEPTGHLVATFTLDPDGTDFTLAQRLEPLASDDEWTSPIMAEVGPDGNVWVIDWYNFIVQHNPTPAGFKTGKGDAYETPLRDKTHGRIYRIVAKDGKPSERPKLSKDDPKELVAALKNDNMFWRLHAQRLLVERGKDDVVPDLVEARRRHVGRRDRPERRRRSTPCGRCTASAAWTRPSEAAAAAVAAASKHPSAGVRRNAAQVLPRDRGDGRDVLPAGAARRPRPAGPAGGAAGRWPTLPADADDGASALARRARPTGEHRRRPLAARRGDRRRGAATTPTSSRRSPRRRSTRPPAPTVARARRRGSPSTTPAAARPTSVGSILARARRRPTRRSRDADRRRPRQGLAARTSRRRSTTPTEKAIAALLPKLSTDAARPDARPRLALGRQGARRVRRRAREGPPRRRRRRRRRPRPPASTPPGS